MSWFQKRKDRNLIPPVEDEYSNAGRPALDSRSTNDSYGSRTAVSSPTDSYADIRDRYQRNQPVDVYSRGQGNLDSDRRELFSGHNPEKASTGRFTHDGPTLREPEPGEENEDDVEGIKKQTRWVKQESVNSTRNALRMAREAEETARNTVGRLGSQSGAFDDSQSCLNLSPIAPFLSQRNLPTLSATSTCPKRTPSVQRTRPMNSSS